MKLRNLGLVLSFLLLSAGSLGAYQNPVNPTPDGRGPGGGTHPGSAPSSIALLSGGLASLWVARSRARAKRNSA